jgi:hypothetical protein
MAFDERQTSMKASRITVISGQCILMFLEPVVSAHAVHRWINKVVGAYPR